MSVNLSSINESQQSGGRKQRNLTEPLIGSFSGGGMPPEVGEKQYIIFKLVKKQKGRVYIDGRCDNVKNPKTSKMERIHLLQGADSIWQSDLIELLKDKDYTRHNYMSLVFEDGVCRLHIAEDANKIEYARNNRHNVGKNRNGSGKWDFFEYDPQEEAKARLDREDKEIAMMLEAKQMDVERMKKMAAFFNVRFIDDLGMPIGDDGVRSELIRVAKRDPYLFEKYTDSKEVEISWMVKRAIMDAKIDLNGQQGNAIWANGKGFISKIPQDRKAYEYLTELAMTNSEEGKKFKEQLQSIVK